MTEEQRPTTTIAQRCHRILVAPFAPQDAQGTKGAVALRRRRIVVAIALLVGAALLGLSLSAPPGSTTFYPLTLALAATWTTGGFASGPLHLGTSRVRGRLRRPILAPVLVGALATAVFVLGALAVREIPPAHRLIVAVLAHETHGHAAVVATLTVLTGIAEEIFFRGALFAAVGTRCPVMISTAVYAITTLATGNVMLAFAALILGGVLGQQRRSTGGILAPILTHVTWSLAMFFILPVLFVS